MVTEFAFAELTYSATYTAAIFSELPKSHPVVHCRVFAKHATLILPRSLFAVLPCGKSYHLLRSITSSEDLYHCFDFAWGSGAKVDNRYIHEDKTQCSLDRRGHPSLQGCPVCPSFDNAIDWLTYFLALRRGFSSSGAKNVENSYDNFGLSGTRVRERLGPYGFAVHSLSTTVPLFAIPHRKSPAKMRQSIA